MWEQKGIDVSGPVRDKQERTINMTKGNLPEIYTRTLRHLTHK